MNLFTDEYSYADYQHHTPAADEYGPSASQAYLYSVKTEGEYYGLQQPTDPYYYDAAPGYCGYGQYDTTTCNSWSSPQEYAAETQPPPPYACNWTSAADDRPQIPLPLTPLPPPPSITLPEPVIGFCDVNHRSVEHAFQSSNRGPSQINPAATTTTDQLFSECTRNYNKIYTNRTHI